MKKGESPNKWNALKVISLILGIIGTLVVTIYYLNDMFQNTPPNAEFLVVPETPNVGDKVIFDASNSCDSDGEIAIYEWSFGDGCTSFGCNVNHSYSDSGEYIIKLMIIDDGGKKDNITREIKVNQVKAKKNDPPLALFSFKPLNPIEGEKITFDGLASYDPDGKIVSYNWMFGDGEGSTYPHIIHSYSEDGKFVVQLTVTDDQDEKGTHTEAIIVKPEPVEPIQNEPPEANFVINPENKEIGMKVTFDASGSRDTDGYIKTYEWDFGDGETSEGPITEHSYSEEGRFRVRLTVTDDQGEKGIITKTITLDPVNLIQNKPPEANFVISPDNPEVGVKVTFDASGSSDPDGYIKTYMWDFGDGEISEDQCIEHSYSEDGSFSVLLTVTDDKGEKDTRTRTVVVHDPIPISVVLVIDNSLSMTRYDPENKRADAAKSLVGTLNPSKDEVGLVILSAYYGREMLLMGRTITFFKSNFSIINESIDGMDTPHSGSINITHGLQYAIDIFMDRNYDSRKYIVFFSDGIFDIPMTNDDLNSISSRSKVKGIEIWTVGFSSDIDGVRILQEIAESTGGEYSPFEEWKDGISSL